MFNKSFCHLHNHCTFSLLDGLGSPDKWCAKAKKMGFEYLAITDHGSIDNMIKFQKAADTHEIKSIFGTEAYIVPDMAHKGKEKRGHITLLVKNKVGFNNLCLMLNKANLEGFYHRPRIDYKTLLNHCEGLVVMTACVGSFLWLPGGMDLFWDLDEKIRGDLYLEVMPHIHDLQYDTNDMVLDIHEQYPDIKLVVTNDCHFPDKEDQQSQEVLLAVNSKALWSDPKRFKFDEGFQDLYLKSADEMIQSFYDQDQLTDEEIEEAMATTIEVAEKCCDFRIDQVPIKLPKVRENGEEYIREICLSELERIEFAEGFSYEDYVTRFEREFNLIKRKGFIDYFLIVDELIQWCMDQGIMVGSGRGSIGGSLMGFLLGITCVDPLKYKLLFERFIDEESDHIPDIDIDFPDNRRNEVRLHLQDKYGTNNIAGVSTFIKMKGKYCVRDVSRVFEVPLKDVNDFCEIIDKNVDEAIEKDSSFKQKYPEVTNHILKLEGNLRTAGKHASAVIVSPYDLTKGIRSTLVKRKKEIVLNWDKDDAEYMGLMKLDVLGLNTLTILNETKLLIKESLGKEIIFEKISLNDKKVLKSIDGKNVAGLFQLNGNMAKQVTKDLEVDSFHDIVMILALGRPGPFSSGQTEEYIKRKHGKKWQNLHPLYEEVLKDTYGCICFQENVIYVINKVAGLPFTTADKVRKIIGKKRDVKEFAKYEEEFINGCLKQKTLSRQEANKVWEGFLQHADYSFNMSHTVAYGMIAYWTAFIKYYYPIEFFCANLTYGKEDKKAELIKEAKKQGIEIMLPKINKSDPFKWVAKDNKLYVPFNEIKGVGDKMAPKLASLKRAQPKLNDTFFKRKISGAVQSSKDKKSKLEQIADDIGAWGELCPLTAKAQEYFSFQISDRVDIMYPNLCKVIDDMFPCDVDDVLEGKVGYPHLIHQTEYANDKLKQCNECSLRSRCLAPIEPTKGKYNIAIVDGLLRKSDNVQGHSLSGDTGNLLWSKLRKYGFKKDLFHVTNVVKCFPGAEKPSAMQINKCVETWLLPEIDQIDCRIILALGSIPAKVFAPEGDGIQKMNSTTIWSEKFQSWVCFSAHPASTFTDPSNKMRFNHGIANFVNLLKLFDLKK